MAKIIKNRSAQLFFTLTHNQFVNGKITKRTYFMRLEKLSNLISQSSTLYAVIADILAMDYEIRPLAKYRKNGMLHEKYDVLMEKVNASGQLIEFKVLGKNANFHPGDQDDLPSVPHLHFSEIRCKMDVYTGIFTDDTMLSDKEFVALWNNEEFFNKLYKNRLSLML